MRLETLRKRAEFLAVRGGQRCATPAFVIEAKKRRATGQGDASTGPRFGFTITKKVGNAVVRNRIRRRLKAALAEIGSSSAIPGHDYVVIARLRAFDIPFPDLQKDLERALQRVHHAGASPRGHKPNRAT